MNTFRQLYLHRESQPERYQEELTELLEAKCLDRRMEVIRVAWEFVDQKLFELAYFGDWRLLDDMVREGIRSGDSELARFFFQAMAKMDSVYFVNTELLSMDKRLLTEKACQVLTSDNVIEVMPYRASYLLRFLVRLAGYNPPVFPSIKSFQQPAIQGLRKIYGSLYDELMEDEALSLYVTSAILNLRMS